MDAAEVLVAVMTSAAVGWLIWVEVHSRRNTAVQKAKESSSVAELKSVEDSEIGGARRDEQAQNPNLRRMKGTKLSSSAGRL